MIKVRNLHIIQVTITESFAWSVDYVAEKIRISRQAGEDIDKFIVVYFDYAGEHDVPPKLDVAIRYTLMNDMLSLYCHLHGVKWETMAATAPDSLLDSSDQMELVDRENNNKVEAGQVVSSNGVTHDTFTQTQTGGELLEAINAAKKFFKEKPDWLGEILEAVGNAATPSPNPKNKVSGKEDRSEVKQDENSTTEGTKSPETQTDSQESSPTKNVGENGGTEDPTYKERQKRRMKEEEKYLDLLQLDEKKQETNGETSKENENEKSSPVINGRVPPPPPQKSISLVDLPVNHSPLFNQRQDNSVDIPIDNKSFPGKLSRTVSNPNDGDLLRKELQLNSPDFNKTRNPNEKRRNSKSQSNTTLQRMNAQCKSDDSILSNGLDDDELQKDIEFIQNFDAHHAHVHNQCPPSLPPLQTLNTAATIAPPILGQPSKTSNDLDPIVLDLDLSEYTPPEDFITLANQFESNHGNAGNHDSNGFVNELDNTAINMETNGNADQDNTGFVNPVFDSNANKLGVKSMNHFVIDFVDPSVKHKPEQLKRTSSTSSS